MVANCTPCEGSLTVSGSGHLVAVMRPRRSTSAASGTLTWNGRMAVFSVVGMDKAPFCCAVPIGTLVVACALPVHRGKCTQDNQAGRDRSVTLSVCSGLQLSVSGKL